MACSFSRIGWLAGLLVSLGIGTGPALAQKAETVALCKAEKSEKGIAACTAILKGRGDLKVRASALLSRGQAYWALQRLAEAEKDYSEAIRLVPNFGALYRDRAQIRFALGNQEGAMADFTIALDKDPFDADNHANRGYLRMLQYDFAGAGEDLRKGLFWQKLHPRSEYMLGLLHYSTGRYSDAVAQIDKARAGGFRGSEAFITRARSLYYLGTFEAAAREASEGLQAFPTQSDLTEIRARARLARRDYSEALADAEAVVQAAPRSGRAYATRGAVRLAIKDIAGATVDADKALERDASLFDAHELKADILLAAGDQAGARAILARSAARTDARMDYDVASRARHAARVAEFDKPKPILVTDLDEAELKTRCGKRDDPLRLQSCDRLVETAATPEAKAEKLILRSQARPYEQNLADLDLAVAAAPGYPPALIARAYRHLGHFGNDSERMRLAWADADSAVRLATAGSTDWRNAMLARVAVYLRRGDFPDAIADLTRIVEADPDAIEAVGMDRVSAYLMAGRPDAALAELAIFDRMPDPPGSFGNFRTQMRTLALLELGRVEEANAVLDAWESKTQGSVDQDSFEKSMRDPLRARALLLSGSDRAAFDLAAAAVGPHDSNDAALAVRGVAAARLGNALAAVSDLTSVIDQVLPVPDEARFNGLTPGFAADLFLYRGLARVQLRQVNAARADFAEAIRRAPNRARPYAERARLAFMADNPAALADIAMALRIEPAEPRWLALAARINHATGDMAAADRFATQALAAKLTEPDIVLLRAKARLALGRFAEAAEDATARLGAAPSDADALLVRIEARTGQGDLKAALTDAEAARAAQGGDARILLALAELKARTGDAPGAIGAFEEAAAKPDAALQANKRLGDLYAGIASDQLALGYYAKAIEQPARRPDDEALRMAARAARDALIRKMAVPK